MRSSFLKSIGYFMRIAWFWFCLGHSIATAFEYFQYPINLTFTNTRDGESIRFQIISHAVEEEISFRCREVCQFIVEHNHIPESRLYDCIVKAYGYYTNSHPDLIKVFNIPIHYFSSEFTLFIRDLSSDKEWYDEIALNIHMNRKYIQQSQPEYHQMSWDSVRDIAQSLIWESIVTQVRKHHLSFTQELNFSPIGPKEIIFPDVTAGVIDDDARVIVDSSGQIKENRSGESMIDISLLSSLCPSLARDLDYQVVSHQNRPPLYHSGFLHYEALVASQDMSKEFLNAFPWPHIAVDGLVDPLLARQASQELQYFAESRSNLDPDWEFFFNQKEYKYGRRNFRKYGPATRKIIAELKAEPFLQFLQRVTGISGLIPDPYDRGAAMHVIEPGGYLQVHLDFAYHYQLHLHRRINVLLYLNDEDWDADWHGELELWAPLKTVKRDRPDFVMVANETVLRSSKDPSLLLGRGRVIEPFFNRMAILELSNVSFHGHPQVLRAPKGRFRKSIAMYYYTSDIFPPSMSSPEFLKLTTDFADKLPEKFSIPN